LRIGILPVRHHYYEPFVVPSELKQALNDERQLPGIDFNVQGQLEFLAALTFEKELDHLLSTNSGPFNFRFGNQSFESGDAEYLYQVIRRMKPARLYEIGSGQSTLVARAAIKKNGEDNAGYSCRHICVEPYEAPWLEALEVEVVRRRVEDVDKSMFLELQKNDILFIDSSHVIRPQGDVLAEYLQILPVLRSGVVVHIHDIFTPRDYLREWVIDSLMLWNEQYILEAFLTNNSSWEIIGALNFLAHSHYSELKRVCPYLTEGREPGSIYLQRK
jgi:hypothetical protein